MRTRNRSPSSLHLFERIVHITHTTFESHYCYHLVFLPYSPLTQSNAKCQHHQVIIKHEYLNQISRQSVQQPLRHFTPKKTKVNHMVLEGKRQGTPKPPGIILWGLWISTQYVMTIHPIGPKWWTDRRSMSDMDTNFHSFTGSFVFLLSNKKICFYFNKPKLPVRSVQVSLLTYAEFDSVETCWLRLMK